MLPGFFKNNQVFYRIMEDRSLAPQMVQAISEVVQQSILQALKKELTAAGQDEVVVVKKGEESLLEEGFF